MEQRIRVLLLAPHLGGGGAEKVSALLARGLPASKYELHLGLVVEYRPGPLKIPSHVAVHELHARRVRYAALKLIGLVWRVRPAVVLSNMAHLNFLVLTLRGIFPQDTRVLVRQNGTPSAMVRAARCPWLARILYRRLYPQADRVICQTQAMADDLAPGLDSRRIAILPNPMEVEEIRLAADAPSLWPGAGPHLLAVGRLAPEKGFDLLIDALALLRHDIPHADLTIAGEGHERAVFEERAQKLGLGKAVRFAGHVDQPWRWFPGASLFVLSSRHEGMPNALLEAAAGGLPIVATPASGGVIEFLGGLPGVWLAREITAAALADALLLALRSLETGQRFDRAELLAAHHGDAIQAYAELIDAACAARPA